MRKKIAALACLSMAIAVGCGAFGAHALRDSLSDKDLSIWNTAVLYQLIHSLAALFTIIAQGGDFKRSVLIATLFLLSALVFSGSLYLLVILDQRWLGAITPLGGSGFIITWLLLARTLLKTERR